MNLDQIVLLLNVISTWFMFGLIWFVQVVHYPLFEKVESAHFATYQKYHQRLTTFVVGPPMLVEAFSTILLVYFIPPNVPLGLVLTGIVLLFVIWISTAALQVPCHSKLEKEFDAPVHRRLVVSNWIRTIGWTARGAIVSWMLVSWKTG